MKQNDSNNLNINNDIETLSFDDMSRKNDDTTSLPMQDIISESAPEDLTIQTDVHTFNNVENVNAVEFPEQSIYDASISTDTKKEANNLSKNDIPNNSGNHSTKYVSYEKRMLFLVFSSVACLLLSIVSINLASTFYDKSLVNYTVSSSSSYNVCLSENEYYESECLDEGFEYISALVKSMKGNFTYDEVYTAKTKYDYSYYVMADVKIFNGENEEKVLYKNSELLGEKKHITGSDKNVKIHADVEIPFIKYRDFVIGYINKYSLVSSGEAEISLYLESERGVQKISSLVIPLKNQTFTIGKTAFTNNGLVENTIDSNYRNAFIFFLTLALLFVILGMVALVLLILFFIKTSKPAKPYQKELARLLKEYDCVIAETKVANIKFTNKKMCKVKSFLELLDIRDTLEKPILYERVNNVKSNFYVEDVDTVYIYVMKEADFINNKKTK